MKENVAGALCYLFGWITGIIFFLIDKRPFVRFHAAQSIVVFGGLNVVSFVMGSIFGMRMMRSGAGMSMLGGIYDLFSVLCLALAIVLIIKAYQGERFRVPLAADISDQIFGKS